MQETFRNVHVIVIVKCKQLKYANSLQRFIADDPANAEYAM